jgi:hypothetical protein
LQDLFENIQDSFETDLDMDLDNFGREEAEFASQVMPKTNPVGRNS